VPVFFSFLLLALPFLTKWKEDFFRRGHREWKSIARQSIKFGLAHCLAGVPLAASIALIVLGFFLGLKYKRAFDRFMKEGELSWFEAEGEAVMASTAYHTFYNSVFVAMFIAVSFASLF
jgi:hypothetical protein